MSFLVQDGFTPQLPLVCSSCGYAPIESHSCFEGCIQNMVINIIYSFLGKMDTDEVTPALDTRFEPPCQRLLILIASTDVGVTDAGKSNILATPEALYLARIKLVVRGFIPCLTSTLLCSLYYVQCNLYFRMAIIVVEHPILPSLRLIASVALRDWVCIARQSWR